MKTIRKNQLRFAALPADYAALCRMHLPRPIHDAAEYDNTNEIAEAFAGFENVMTAGQTDYFDLLASLLEAWETTRILASKKTPVETLRHLLDEHGLTATGLSRILDASPKLGPMILRGDRAITADHARQLGRYFNLPAGVFIE